MEESIRLQPAEWSSSFLSAVLPITDKKFCTGSSYSGEWDNCHRMHGTGVYRFPNGVEYHGQFKEGVFHGDGYILFPNHYKVRAKWDHGKLGSYEIVFPDDLIFVEKNWAYCTKGDRRYAECIRQGIPPVGDGYITKEKPPRDIPPGCYDTEEGFYNPKTGLLYSVENPNLAVRVPSSEEDRWAIANCRKAERETVGFYGALDIINDMTEQDGDEESGYQYTKRSEYVSYTDQLSQHSEDISVPF